MFKRSPNAKKEPAGVVIGQNKQSFFAGQKKLLVLILLVLASLTVLAVWFTLRPGAKKVVEAPCTSGSGVHHKLATAIGSGNLDSATVLKNQIISDPGYKSDVNCLAGLTEFALMTGDIESAEDSMKLLKLQKVTEETKLDAAYLKLGIDTIKSLRAQVDQSNEARKKSYETTLLF